MKKTLNNNTFGLLSVLCSILLMASCGIYSFTGGDVGNAKTIQIDYINNNAPLVEPTLSQSFTTALQDYFITQTSLSLVKNNGDLQFEGEITKYTPDTPIAATADQTAAQTRLTIEVNIRFYNREDETKNFEKKISHFYDYAADEVLEGDVLETAYDEIFERIHQNIFNASVANW